VLQEAHARQRVGQARNRGFRQARAFCNFLIPEKSIAKSKTSEDCQSTRQRRDELSIARFTLTM
jgi:hypothetical protein